MRTLATLLAATAIAAFGFAGTASAHGFGDGATVIVIDIKPFSDPNSVNTKSRGVVPVAICNGGAVVNDVTIDDTGSPTGFSGATTNINLNTIEFAVQSDGSALGTVASPKHLPSDQTELGAHMTQFVASTLSKLDAPNCAGGPVGPDLAVHFPQRDTGLLVGDDGDLVCVQADLKNSTHLRGCDFVRIKK